MVKNFNTINYEGTQGWIMNSLYTDTDRAIPINASFTASSLAQLEANLFTNNFKQKENKYFGNIFNNTIASGGDVIYGQSMSGIKGLYAVCTMTLNNAIYPNQAELYVCHRERKTKSDYPYRHRQVNFHFDQKLEHLHHFI
jgi:hypothetical protein